MTTRIALGVFACLFAMALTGRAQPPALDTDAIAKAWQDRQDKVKTAKFETKRTILIPQGMETHEIESANRRKRLLGKPLLSFTGPFPRNDTQLVATESVILDDRKLRYDYLGRSINWSDRESGYVQFHAMTSFDGEVYRERFDYPWGPQGATRKSTVYPDANMLALNTYLNTVRGRTQTYTTINPCDLVATGRSQPINGYSCNEYKLPGRGIVYHAWLSPKQGWNIVRLIGTHEDKQSTKNQFVVRQDRKYSPDEQIGWIPSSWESTSTSNGRVTRTDRFEVVNYTINQSLANTAFNIDFEPGLRVLDDSPGGFSGVMQADRSFQPDKGRSAYYLPGMQEPAYRWWGRLLAYVILAILCVVLLVRCCRRWRRQPDFLPPSLPEQQDGQPNC